jgi:Na+-driven multidrug efflux pump
MVAGIPFQLAATSITAMYVGTLRAGRVTAISFASVLLNLALLPILIPLWGSTGGAISKFLTVIATASAGWLLVTLDRDRPQMWLRRDADLSRELFSNGRLLAAQQAMAHLMVATLYTTVQYGVGTAASGALSMTHGGYFQVHVIPLLAISQTVTAVTSAAVGRGDFRQAFRLTCGGLLFAGSVAALGWMVVFALQDPILHFFMPVGASIEEREVIAHTARHFSVFLLLFTLADIPINLIGGLYRSCGLRYLAAATFVGLLTFSALLPTLFGMRPKLDSILAAFLVAQGVWAALLAGRLFARGGNQPARLLTP